jgi:hypothetical protein
MPAFIQSSANWRGLGAYLDCIRADAPFHSFVAAYAAVGWVVGLAAGVPHKYVPLAYTSYSVPLAMFAMIIAGGLWRAWSREPLAGPGRVAALAAHPKTVAASLLFISLGIHMGVFTSVKTMLPDIASFHADPWLADLDEAIHGAAPSHYTMALLPAGAISLVCSLYFGVWGLLLLAGLLAVLFVPKLRAVRTQFVWTYLLAWPLLGNVGAGAAMSAGPVFYGVVTGDTERFAALTSYLQHFPPLGEGAAYLWQTHASGRPSAATGISAFPSMHLAHSTLLVLLATRVGRKLTWMAAAFCAFILFGSVHLGWHYAVDGYFSIIATVTVWFMVGRMLSKFGAHNGSRLL